MSLLGTESEEKEQTTISSQPQSLKNNSKSKDLTGEIDNFKLLIISAGSKYSDEKSSL